MVSVVVGRRIVQAPPGDGVPRFQLRALFSRWPPLQTGLMTGTVRKFPERTHACVQSFWCQTDRQEVASTDDRPATQVVFPDSQVPSRTPHLLGLRSLLQFVREILEDSWRLSHWLCNVIAMPLRGILRMERSTAKPQPNSPHSCVVGRGRKARASNHRSPRQFRPIPIQCITKVTARLLWDRLYLTLRPSE